CGRAEHVGPVGACAADRAVDEPRGLEVEAPRRVVAGEVRVELCAGLASGRQVTRRHVELMTGTERVRVTEVLLVDLAVDLFVWSKGLPVHGQLARGLSGRGVVGQRVRWRNRERG